MRPGNWAAALSSLPGLWLGCAAAFLPAVEFLVRAQLGDRIAGSVVTALWFAGTLAVMVAKGSCAGPGKAGRWLALLAAVSAVAAVAGGSPVRSLPSITLLCAGLAVFSLAGSRPAGVSRLAAGLLAGGAIASVLALWQRFFGFALLAPVAAARFAENPGLSSFVQSRIAEARAFGFFVYPNALGGFLALGIPCALEKWRGARGTGAPSLAWGLLVLLLVSGLFSSGSMGAVFAIVLSLLVTALLRRGQSGRQARAMLVGALVLAGAVVASRPSSAFPGALKSKASHLAGAIASWRGPVALVLGTGPGTYGEKVGSKMPGQTRARFAHNWPVETFVESGLAGLAALAGFLALLLSAFARAVRGKAGWGLWAGWLAMLVHMMADIDYALPSLFLPWLGVGGAMAASVGRDDNPGMRQAGAPGGAIPALVISVGLALLPLFRGSTSGLLFSSLLGLAVFLVLARVFSGASLDEWVSRKDAPLLALFAAGILWTGFSPAPARTYPSVLEGGGLLALFLLSRRIAGSGGWRGRLPEWTVMALSMFHGTWALLEGLATRMPAFTTFPSPNFLAAFILPGLGMGAWRALESRGIRRLFPALVATVSFAGIVATRSSGAAIASGGVAVIILAVKGLQAGTNRFRWWSGAVALSLGLAIAAIPPINPVSLSQRLNIWKEGTLALRHAPMGWGPGRYAAAAERFRLPSYTTAGIGRYSLRADFAHCEPLQFAVEWGIPAFGLLVWLGLSVIARAGKADLAWLFGILGVALHSLVDFPLRAPPVEALVAVLLGGALAGTLRADGKRPRKERLPRLAAVVLALSAGISVARPAVSRFIGESGAGKSEILSAYPLDVSGLRMGAIVAGGSGGSAAPRYLPDYVGLRSAVMLSGGDVDLETETLENLNGEWKGRSGGMAAEEFIEMELGASMRSGSDPAKVARYLYLLGRGPESVRWLKRAQAREPFDLALYSWEARMVGGRGAKQLERKAILLRKCLSKRRGMNDYEAGLLGAGRTD